MRAIDLLRDDVIYEVVVETLRDSIEGVELYLQDCQESEKAEYRDLLTALHKVKKYHEVPHG